MQHAVDYFSKLYEVDDYQLGDYPIEGHFSRIEDELLDMLSCEISMKEVKHALFSMAPLKSSGIDDFHVKFYQDNWDIVGSSIFEMVSRVFTDVVLDPWLNRTLLVLIPKQLGVETIKQFKPISLCTVLYKVITKLIVIRLRRVMQILVKQNQSSFIAARSISDKIVMAQEAIHTMKTTRNKKGWMAVKVDMEKAYDRIRWIICVTP